MQKVDVLPAARRRVEHPCNRERELRARDTMGLSLSQGQHSPSPCPQHTGMPFAHVIARSENFDRATAHRMHSWEPGEGNPRHTSSWSRPLTSRSETPPLPTACIQRARKGVVLASIPSQRSGGRCTPS